MSSQSFRTTSGILNSGRSDYNYFGENINNSRYKHRQITQDDINQLKLELQKLQEERKQLNIKIARLEVQAKRAARTTNANPKLLTQLDREYKNVEHMIMQQRAQINELLISDAAAQRQELQEEAKIIYLERIRLQDLQLQQQMALNDAKKELEELLASDGPAKFHAQAQKISELEEKLAKYEHANKKLTDKVKRLKASKMQEQDGIDGSSKAAMIRKQIRETEAATEEIERKIQESTEKHKDVMKSLQISLLNRTSPDE